jgi:hypothetical protein
MLFAPIMHGSANSKEPVMSPLTTHPHRLRRLRSRRPFRALLIGAATLLAVAFAQVPAHADYTGTVLYICQGQEVQNFTPALTSTVQNYSVHVQGTLSCNPHASTGNENFTVLSYDYATVGIATSCTTVLSTSLGTNQLKWHYGDVNNSAKSTLRFERTMTTASGEIVYTDTGNITNGVFQAAIVSGETTIATTQLANCYNGVGVNQLSGPAEFIALKGL